MLGIGLGGFMEGYERGTRIKQQRAANERQKMLDQRSDEQYQRQKVMQQRDDEAYNRVKANQDAIDAVNKDAQQQFNQRVSAGQEKPDNFERFWSNYALPKLRNTYLSQGNTEMADKVQQWGDSADARAGAKLAMSAIQKAQTGDAAGALTDAMQAGKLKGYLNHTYEILGQDQILDTDGKLQGYRLRMKTPDGQELNQDLPLAKVPQLVATYLNPEAAWQSQIAAQNEKTKTANELKTYEDKKAIDKRYSDSGDKSRTDAIKSLRKRMDGGITGKEQKFDDLSREEQEKMIAEEIALQRGGGGGQAIGLGAAQQSAQPGRKVVVDTATGRPMIGLGQ